MRKPIKPFWMRLHVDKFIADTATLTATQAGAYVRLLCAMWRADDGTLPNDPDVLARVSMVHRPTWAKVWGGIKSLFDVDGDRVTSTSLQAELGMANARIVTARANASLGGRTTQFNRSMRAGHTSPVTASKPLNNCDGVQADAQANYSYNINKKEEGETSPLPRKGEASVSQKEASSGVLLVNSPAQPQTPHDPEGPSQEERDAGIAKWETIKKSKLRGGSAA